MGRGSRKRHQQNKPVKTQNNIPQSTHCSAKDVEYILRMHQQDLDQKEYENTKHTVLWLRCIVARMFEIECIVWGIALLLSICMTIAFVCQPWTKDTWGALLICIASMISIVIACYCEMKGAKARVKEVYNMRKISDLLGLLATILALITFAFAILSFVKDAPDIFRAIKDYVTNLLQLA